MIYRVSIHTDLWHDFCVEADSEEEAKANVMKGEGCDYVLIKRDYQVLEVEEVKE
jgi:hypothetical protein